MVTQLPYDSWYGEVRGTIPTVRGRYGTVYEDTRYGMSWHGTGTVCHGMVPVPYVMAWYCTVLSMKYLILRAAVVVDDPNTAAQGHRYGHVGLRHRVHRGGHKGGAQRYFLESTPRS